MHKGRLEAFSDGVIAIIITIMVLELRVPQGTGLAALAPMVPVLCSYVMSFIYIGIYWNNHHHLLQASSHVGGGVLWANLHLLFWLSLVPLITGWLGRAPSAPVPVAVYGAVLFMAGTAYWVLAQALVRRHGRDSLLARALGRDVKGLASLVIYAAAIAASFWDVRLAYLGYISVAVIWLVPDDRIERTLADARPRGS